MEIKDLYNLDETIAKKIFRKIYLSMGSTF